MLAATACGRGHSVAPPDLPAVGAQVSLFRFPRGGGPVQAYQPDSLRPSAWRSVQPVPALHRLLGVDLDERLIWVLDNQGQLLALDLETRAVRKVAGKVSAAALGPDGSVFLVDSARRVQHLIRRQPVPFHDPLPIAPRMVYGAVNEQLIALTSGSAPRLITATADQDVHSEPLPAGEVGITNWGDLVAVASDSGVMLYETAGQRGRSTISSVRNARRVGFSPSGHRLYVTLESPEIRVYDRFSLKQLKTIGLPGMPREFRVDASGRWLLVHPITGDSLWVVDLATNALSATVPGTWAADLPLVAGAATLIVRSREDVLAYDLLQAPPKRIAELKGGGTDLWLAGSWVPRERLPAAVAAAESASVTQDSALRVDSTATATDSIAIYLQVSRTQNPDWAELLSKQLKGDGFPALVLAPKEEEDGYRVLVGPYDTREAAESTGKRLGRAYFVLKLPAKRP